MWHFLNWLKHGGQERRNLGGSHCTKRPPKIWFSFHLQSLKSSLIELFLYTSPSTDQRHSCHWEKKGTNCQTQKKEPPPSGVQLRGKTRNPFAQGRSIQKRKVTDPEAPSHLALENSIPSNQMGLLTITVSTPNEISLSPLQPRPNTL